jgi:hypothetical protein
MSRKEAAQYLGVAVGSLDVDACRGNWGIPRLRIGRRVVYEKTALDRWLAERRAGKKSG